MLIRAILQKAEPRKEILLTNKTHLLYMNPKRELTYKRLASKRRPTKFGSEEHMIISNGFKEFLKKNNTALRDFLRARKAMAKTGTKAVSLGSVNVQRMTGGYVNSGTYCVECGGELMFVKEIRRSKIKKPVISHNFEAEIDLAHAQIQAMEFAHRLLANTTPKAEVAEYHLAYVTPAVSYLATKFYKGTLVENLGKWNLLRKWQWNSVSKDVQYTLLPHGFGDIKPANCIWCPDIKKFVFFDFRRTPPNSTSTTQTPF